LITITGVIVGFKEEPEVEVNEEHSEGNEE
jgi:hypothetical protein